MSEFASNIASAMVAMIGATTTLNRSSLSLILKRKTRKIGAAELRCQPLSAQRRFSMTTDVTGDQFCVGGSTTKPLPFDFVLLSSIAASHGLDAGHRAPVEVADDY
ncbi:hypothetical protein CRG98_018956 [Punica granatum]|uniref:Uncharacterized protein n=1 Tax=Punica granatum TaxID=22663 RepID=A0A2I0JWL1_PUNGR|nr:hypothetical protein CRG98_018956 [Punica granatum]